MNADGYFVEKQSWGETRYEVLPDSHVSFKTARQQVDLITNPHFGRMLFLDGVLQSASTDEHIYHEALVQLGITHETRRVLIAGGAEGAVVREVAKGKSVEKIVMVDWDRELVEHLCKKECMNSEAFQDSRLELLYEDILDYLEKTNTYFDVVYLDLLDIHTEEEYQFMRAVLEKVNAPEIVLNVGSSREIAKKFFNDKLVTEIQAKKYNAHIKEIFVPSFQEPWYLLWLKVSL